MAGPPPELCEELCGELEALNAVYGHDATALGGPRVAVRLTPRTAHDDTQQFIAARLVLDYPPGFPRQAPVVSIDHLRGLDEERAGQLQMALTDALADWPSQEPQDYAGCGVLLVERGAEYVTANNRPAGVCSFCLEQLSLTDAGPPPLAKLMSCWHVFHMPCLRDWWAWVERELEANAEAVARGPRGALQKEPWGPACPVCRRAIGLADLPPDVASRAQGPAGCPI